MAHARGVVSTIVAVAIILILVSTFASAGPVQLKNDNGDFYQGSFVGRIEGDIDGAVFSPDPALFPITIQSVEFGFHRPRGADHISDSAQVRVQIYAMASGVPGDILAESAPQTLAGFDVWHSIALPQPLILNQPITFMAAVKWESGTDAAPAPSIATDSNLDAPQAVKDQANLFHDANLLFAPPPCVDGFCTHSEFWGDPDLVGFNMIRVTIDTSGGPPATATPTATATATPTHTPSSTPTATATPTLTATATGTSPGADTATPTPTGTLLPAATATPTGTRTSTPTRTATPTPTGTATRTPTTVPTVVPAECHDLSGNGRVDMSDIQLVAGCWKSRNASCLQYDFMPDQKINIRDVMLLAAQYGCAAVTPTPTSTPTATVTPTPPPPPPGRSNLIARVFLDYRCDRFYQSGVDTPLGDIPVTISFPDGSGETRRTTSFGLVYFSGFDSSGGITVTVDLSGGFRGRLLKNCFNSPRTIELMPRDFQSGSKTVQFGAEVRGEGAAP